MAKQVLPVNFTDDLLAESMDGKRKYQMIDNGDGTISLEDVSEYLQMGSVFGAGQINSTNQAVNESVDKDKILKTLEEVSASTDSDAVVGRGAVAELNQNFRDGVNTIVSAVNTKTGSALTGANTPAEIAEVITNIETAKNMLLISCHDGGANSSQMSSAPCAVMRIDDHELKETTWYGYLTNNPTTLANAVKLEYTYTSGWVVTALKALKYYDGQSKSQKSLAKNATISWKWNEKRNLIFYL